MREWISVHTRALLWVGFIVSAAGVVVWACGQFESDTDSDAHTCVSSALAHQRQPSDGASYQGQVPNSGWMQACFCASLESAPDGHRALFYRKMGWRPQGGSTWAVYYAPPHWSDSILPGQSLQVWDYNPDQGCSHDGLGPAGWYEYMTRAQAELRKGTSQCTSTAQDIVLFYITP